MAEVMVIGTEQIMALLEQQIPAVAVAGVHMVEQADRAVVGLLLLGIITHHKITMV